MPLNVALTERLAFIADKDGYAVLNPRRAVPSRAGWLNLAVGSQTCSADERVDHQFVCLHSLFAPR
jgi:hypothetical protein